MDRVGNELQGDAQNNNGTLGAYIPRTLFLYIYQAGAVSTTYIYFLYFIFFTLKKK